MIETYFLEFWDATHIKEQTGVPLPHVWWNKSTPYLTDETGISQPLVGWNRVMFTPTNWMKQCTHTTTLLNKTGVPSCWMNHGFQFILVLYAWMQDHLRLTWQGLPFTYIVPTDKIFSGGIISQIIVGWVSKCLFNDSKRFLAETAAHLSLVLSMEQGESSGVNCHWQQLQSQIVE